MDIRAVGRELDSGSQILGQSYADGGTAGVVTLPAGEAGTSTPLFVFVNPEGQVVGQIRVWWDAVGNLAYISFDTFGISSGDIAHADMTATRYNGTDYAYADISSEGEFIIDLRLGHSTADNTQRTRIKAAHSSSNTSSETVTIEAVRSSGATAAGFGSAINFYAANAAGNQTYQGGIGSAFVGGTTNSNVTLAAQNLVKIYNGAGAPSVSGARSDPEAALKNLLSVLQTIGLITDNTV